jgi:flagellar biosynthesis/type III secretory pathway protein FliH
LQIAWEKEQIEKRLSVYDELWENNPMVQKMREEYKAKGYQEGYQEGRREALQWALVTAVRIRFPGLAGFAQHQVNHVDKLEVLKSLFEQVLTAPDEMAVLKLLRSEGKMTVEGPS